MAITHGRYGWLLRGCYTWLALPPNGRLPTAAGLTIDFFPGRAPAAFANVIFQNSLASALAFLIFPSLSTPAATAITGTVCVIAVPSVMYAWRIKQREQEGVVESAQVRDAKATSKVGNDFAYA